MSSPDLGVHISTKDQEKLSQLKGLYITGGSYLSLVREGHQSDAQELLEIGSSSR